MFTLILIALYLIPSMIVLSRRKDKYALVVVLINLCFGWSMIGWIVAFIMAFI